MGTVGFGCPDTTDPHRFEVDIPAGRTGIVSIEEHYGITAGIDGLPQVAERCHLPRATWSMIAEDVKRDFNERLRAKKLTAGRWTVGVNKVERLLGKELLVLAWAVEKASPETVPNAIRNWVGLAAGRALVVVHGDVGRDGPTGRRGCGMEEGAAVRVDGKPAGRATQRAPG